jgi:hypothetical protein
MRRIAGVFFAVFLTVTVVSSQVQPKPLSNKDVIEMVSMGLSNDVIIEKIRSVKTTTFDTSVEGLKSLKAAKVSDAVLKAMINPHGSSAEKQIGQDRQLDDGTADNNLGWAYEHGPGVKQDYQQALTWYRKSAELGNAVGQYNLGWMYQHGLGVKQDYVQAVTWYRRAAGKGLSEAENQLGMLYEDGNGVSRDDRQAVMWFQKAAVQGDAQTKLNLGWMYANGRGVPQDYQQALSWYRKAADQGADLQPYLGDLPSAVREGFTTWSATDTGETKNQEVGKSKDETGISVYLPPPPDTEASRIGPETVSGKVFLITGGGDLKPARFAQVILLYGGVLGGSQDSGTASIFYYTKMVENMKNSWPSPGHPSSCQSELLTFNSSLKSTLEWAQSSGKSSAQIQITTSDEEGAFQFPKVPLGEYTVIAWGHAGFNDAYWEESLKVPPGQSVTLKLSSPHVACLD